MKGMNKTLKNSLRGRKTRRGDKPRKVSKEILTGAFQQAQMEKE